MQRLYDVISFRKIITDQEPGIGLHKGVKYNVLCCLKDMIEGNNSICRIKNKDNILRLQYDFKCYMNYTHIICITEGKVKNEHGRR